MTFSDLLLEWSQDDGKVLTADELREQLFVIRRIAISLVNVTEGMLQLPADKRAIRTREERRSG